MPEEDPLVRIARPGDLEQVAGIYAHYVIHSTATFEETPPTAEQWAQRFAAAGALGVPFLVAEADGEVTGYAYCTPWKARPAYRHTVENSVYVVPGVHGRGIGRALLTRLLQGCADAGVRQVIAVIADTGDPASTVLHRRCGFTDAGRLAQVGYKHGRWLDTLLLQYSLPA